VSSLVAYSINVYFYFVRSVTILSRLLILVLVLSVQSCAESSSGRITPRHDSQNKSSSSSPLNTLTLINNPPSPEESEQMLKTTAENWFFGEGLGKTALNVATVVVFPPYAFYLLGNAGLQIAGLEPLYVTDALPDTPREHVLAGYDSVTSIPGRVTALAAGTNFRENNESIKERQNQQDGTK